MAAEKRESIANEFSPEPVGVESGQQRRKDRVGKRAILFQVPVAAKKQVAILAVELETTQQALLAEALNDLFLKLGKPPIAYERTANRAKKTAPRASRPFAFQAQRFCWAKTNIT